MSRPTAFGVQVRFWSICAVYTVTAAANAVLVLHEVLRGQWVAACFNIGAIAMLAGAYRLFMRPIFRNAYRKAHAHDLAVRKDEIKALEKELGYR